MSKHVSKEEHQFSTCHIEASDEESEFVGILSYKGFEQGKLYGSSLEAVKSQFHEICRLMDFQGAMLRGGTIMLGYHNNDLKGDVLLLDGIVIGRWEMEEHDEWSHFTPEGYSEHRLSAPSPWLLHDSINEWLGDK